jgi:hypothetical protein
MSYLTSQGNRQAILDHLHKNQLKSANQVAIETGITRSSVQSCCLMMTRRGEIEKVGTGMATRYKAIATTTVSAETIIAEMKVKREGSGAKAEKLSAGYGKVSKPGFYRQSGGGWQAQQSSGGQGALRGVVGVPSSMGGALSNEQRLPAPKASE